MPNNLTGNPSVVAEIGQITPDQINPRLLKDVMEIIEPIISTVIPKKRSGFMNAAFIIFQLCIQLLGLSPSKTEKWIESKCKKENVCFQSYKKEVFSNNKERRYFPDQPGLSRYMAKLNELDCVEEFWNFVLLAHALYLRSIDLLKKNVTAIADYTEEPCMKNEDDPYCFGKQDGKTKHKTLTFSIISGDLHQTIANFKIKKRQDKLPLFEKIIETLKINGFNIVYILIDRGFYRKRLLSFFKSEGIGVIMPGRKCAQTAKKITKYLKDRGSRCCKGFINLNYKKKMGFLKLHFDLLLVAKRKYNLSEIKRDLRKKKISLIEASKRIFPLLVLFGKNGGVTKLQGNESYIRDLYRRRWLIEIAFREMNRLGIVNKSQNRNLRLSMMGAKCVLYNMWQVQRFLVKDLDPKNDELSLDEFLGKCYQRRYPCYINC